MALKFQQIGQTSFRRSVMKLPQEVPAAYQSLTKEQFDREKKQSDTTVVQGLQTGKGIYEES